MLNDKLNISHETVPNVLEFVTVDINADIINNIIFTDETRRVYRIRHIIIIITKVHCD
jgi:hypothetical protein